MICQKQVILLDHAIRSMVHIGDLGQIDVHEGISVVCAPMGHDVIPQVHIGYLAWKTCSGLIRLFSQVVD